MILKQFVLIFCEWLSNYKCIRMTLPLWSKDSMDDKVWPAWVGGLFESSGSYLRVRTWNAAQFYQEMTLFGYEKRLMKWSWSEWDVDMTTELLTCACVTEFQTRQCLQPWWAWQQWQEKKFPLETRMKKPWDYSRFGRFAHPALSGIILAVISKQLARIQL